MTSQIITFTVSRKKMKLLNVVDRIYKFHVALLSNFLNMIEKYRSEVLSFYEKKKNWVGSRLT